MKGLILRVTLLSFLCSGLSLPSQGAVLSTQDYLSAAVREEQLVRIDAAMAREDVRQQLVAHGVDPDDALERIAQLPDQDLAELADQMEDLPAGGSLFALIGVVFVVLMILELTGVINIFTNF